MQYTIRNIPAEVDRRIREQARRDGRSLNQLIVSLLERALDIEPALAPKRDLDDIAGTWESDPVAEGAFADQRAIDEELWR